MQSAFNKNGKKLLGLALDDLYYFEDDELENEIEKALIKFEKEPNWRKLTRIYLWSSSKLRNKICKIAETIYGDKYEE